MVSGHITFLGKRYPASPRTVKLFLFIFMPLLLVFSLTSSFIMCQALAYWLGWPTWVLIVALLVLTLEMKFNDGKSWSLMPAPIRSGLWAVLLPVGLYTYATQGPDWKLYWLSVFALQLAISKTRAYLQRRDAQTARFAEGLNQLYGKPRTK